MSIMASSLNSGKPKLALIIGGLLTPGHLAVVPVTLIIQLSNALNVLDHHIRGMCKSNI